MKIVEGIVEFIFHLLKRAISISIITIGIAFVLVIFTIFMPDEVVNAYEILRGFLN